MEITTSEIIIITSFLAACGFVFIYNLYIVKTPTPITEIIEPLPEIIEPITEVIEPAINYVVNNPVLVVPVAPEQIELLLNIFKNNPVYTEAYNLLLKYREKFYNGSVLNEVLVDSRFTQLPEKEQIVELFKRFENTKEWFNISQILRETPPSHELVEAIAKKQLEITYESAQEIAAAYAQVQAQEIAAQTAAKAQEIAAQTAAKAQKIAVPHNSFTDFITSEFGIKCMIAGSAIVVTAIIIHLLVVYYYKTTYTAIAYKCINWIYKL